MDFSVVAVGREDDSPVDEPFRVAAVADRLGYREVWAGEGPTWDSFVLAAAIGKVTERAALTAGPVPVSVRDPYTLARGAASVAAVTGRAVGVALGTSSMRVVEGVHGRPRGRPAAVLEETAAAVRGLLHASPGEPVVPGSTFRRRLAPPGGPLTVAAFGDRAIATAAAHADRMLLDIVTPEQVRELRAKLGTAAEKAGRTPPTLAAWRVEDGPGLVVARISRGGHVADQILAQRGEGRARLRWGSHGAPPSVQGLLASA